ncbi:hypothetical protein KAI32_02275 [Candidatus Pacearchaeota archaeon]|nr:hypothetical protein [Candidatus Pacearchaeota archaeon]
MGRGIVFLVFFLVLSCDGVYALSGVSPASYEIDFKPNLKQNFNFNFLFDEDIEAEVYVSGDLKDYVKLDKKFLKGGGRVIASIDFPSEIEIPGVHRIRIGAKQLASEGGGIAIVSDVGGVIKVKVPYPGKYVGLEFKTSNANVGEDINLELIVSSMGKEDIYAHPILKIFNSDGEIEQIDLGEKFIASTKSAEFLKKLSTVNYKPGDYEVSAVVEYGGEKPVIASVPFRLGELRVEISNWTKVFERDKINRFEIRIESLWNDPIESLYASVEIVDYNVQFSTPSISLEPWKKDILTGFFDARDIDEEKFKANITLFYDGHTTSKIVDLEFEKEFDSRLYVTLAIAVIVLIAVMIFLMLRRKKSEKQKK